MNKNIHINIDTFYFGHTISISPRVPEVVAGTQYGLGVQGGSGWIPLIQLLTAAPPPLPPPLSVSPPLPQPLINIDRPKADCSS